MEKLPLQGYGASETHAKRLATSYFRLTGKPLLEGFDPAVADGEQLIRAMFEAPFIILSHGTESDPVLNYGNRACLQLWEMTWEELTRMPSRLTAEPVVREVREAFLRKVSEKGFADGYEGIRISATGRRFMIENATVWNVTDPDGTNYGQAATFRSWRYVDGGNGL